MLWDDIRRYRPALERYVLTCDRYTPHVPTDLELVLVTVDSPIDLIREAMTVNERGFDPAAPDVDTAAAEAFRPSLIGCCVVTARWQGTAVSGGMVCPVRDGLAELVGIATIAEYRRRGFARAVTSRLVSEAFERGARTAFLTTDDDGARRVYLRVGFRDLAPG